MRFNQLLLICTLLLLGSSLAQEDQMEESTTPAWLQIEITNASTGESFTLADLEGKTVYVEPFATWCSNCRKQLNNLKAAKAQLLSAENTNEDTPYVFLILSLDSNISNERLMEYAEKEGFDFTFAVASPELLSELIGHFGNSVRVPPSTPHFIIRADSSSTDLESGQIESAEELVGQMLAANQGS